MQANNLKEAHIPVLLQEVLNMISPQDNKVYVDATFGAGGYTKAILSRANCTVIGIDCDQHTQNYATEVKQNFKDRFHFVNDNFTNIDAILKNIKIALIDGIVFDLGVSSMQLDDKDRGFSFARDAPLDMRMDNRLSATATKLVNELCEKELADLIYQYGGERKSRLIAKNIVHFRQKEKIATTSQLIEAMQIVKKKYRDNIHFATRTFQALRIAVNSELENLSVTLEKLPTLLASQGTISVVTFHSLEDKIVKGFFKKVSTEKSHNTFEIVNKKVITPSYTEIKTNPRSRSAKLRGLRKIK